MAGRVDATGQVQHDGGHTPFDGTEVTLRAVLHKARFWVEFPDSHLRAYAASCGDLPTSAAFVKEGVIRTTKSGSINHSCTGRVSRQVLSVRHLCEVDPRC